MQYYIYPQGSVTHNSPLEARLGGVTSDPYVPLGLTIQWRQNGAPIKEGNTTDPFYRSINTSTTGDVVFDASDTGSVIDFIIDPYGTATASLFVTLANQAPTASAGVVTDSYSRTTGRPTLNWTYSDADGDPQYSYRVRFGSSPGAGDYDDSGTVISTVETYAYPLVPAAIPAGATYYWTLNISDGEKANPLDPDVPEPTRVLVTVSGTGIVNTAPSVSNVLIDGTAGGATVETIEPTFSWTYADIDGQPQQYYRIVVATSSDLSSGILWDSGFIPGTALSAKYNFNLTGIPLVAHTNLYVGVQAKDTFTASAFTIETFVASNKPILTLLTVDNKVNPKNVRTDVPYFNWAYFDGDDDPLNGFEIRVGDTSEDWGTDSFVGNIWHPGPRLTPEAYKVQFNDDGTAFGACPGSGPLQPGIKYYWQVQVYDLYDHSEWAVGYFMLNTPPQAANLSIIPAAPYTSDDLLALYDFVDDVGDIESDKTQIKWYKKIPGGSTFTEVVEARNLRTVSADLTLPGEIWRFTVRPHDGIAFSTAPFTSSEVTILNRAPAASALTVLPSSPTTSDNLEAIFAASDPDGDTVIVTIRWYRNGSEVVALKNSKIIPASVTTLDDEWYFTVLPSDGYENGPLATSNKVVIRNSPPRISSVSVEGKILPKGVKSGNPAFSWTYFDADQQPQEKFQFVLGTRPLRTRRTVNDLFDSRSLGAGSSALGYLLKCGMSDGMISSADGDGEVLSGDEIFDSGIISSDQNTYQYITPGYLSGFSMSAITFNSLNNYTLSSDLQTLMLQLGATDGVATGKFNGQSSIYDIEMTYIKEDGKRATYKLVVDGVVVGQFTSQPGAGTATHTFNAVRVDSGASIAVSTTATDAGSRAKFRQLQFSPVSSINVKAGDFRTLSGYLQDGNGGIKLAGLAGTASTNFEFPSGTYDIEVVYITETFGSPNLMLSVNNSTVLSFTYESGAKTRSKFVTGVLINKGDTVKISGTRNAGAVARVKEVIFKPRSTVKTGASLKEGLTYFASIRVFDGREWSEWFTTKFAMTGHAWNNVSNANGWTIEARLSVKKLEDSKDTAKNEILGTDQ